MSAKTLLTLLVLFVLSLGNSQSVQANWWQFWKAFTHPSPTLFKNPAPNPARPLAARTMPRQQYSLELRKNMGAANVVCEIAWQAHHIIPVEFAQHDALRKCGFNINAAANGICMPGARVSSAAGIAQHSGYHAGYNTAVKATLDGIPASLSKQQTLERVNKIQIWYKPISLSPCIPLTLDVLDAKLFVGIGPKLVKPIQGEYDEKVPIGNIAGVSDAVVRAVCFRWRV